VGENEYAEFQKNKHYQTVEAIALQERAQVVAVSCEIESQISKLPDADKPMFLESIGATESGLNRLIKKTYALLGLATYFTVGSDECKAWTFKLGMKAPQCAGVIHSDFEKGFIKAEIYHYDDFVKFRSELAIKEAGKLRMEGKEYVVKDGDIIFYRFNV
jgi:ribosome-binding ATPase YchF (GTP1/OBG family)